MRVFTSRDTGVVTMAWSAVQDRQGTLHFGCNTMVSFDGDRWRAEAMDPTYLVRGLDVGPNGRIWVAGVNQIGWFEQGPAPRYHSLMGRLPEGTGDLGDVWRVYALGEEGAVFVAREQVLRWDGARFARWSYPGMHLLWSTRTKAGIYVHYPPVGLIRMDEAGPRVVAPASVIGDSEVRWLDDSRDPWLLLTSKGFKSLVPGRCTPLETEASAFARTNTPTCVARLADGTLALGTLQGGVALLGPGADTLGQVINVGAGLPSNQVYSLFADREGALWATGPSFIARLAISSDLEVYGQNRGYPAGGCDRIEENAGRVFAASHSAVLELADDPGKRGAGHFVPVGITSSRLYGLLSTPSGLAVARVQGLGIWGRGVLRPLTPDGDIVFRASASLARPGAILASFFDRVVAVDPERGTSTVVASGLPDYGDTVVDEPSGRIWIGTPSRGMFVAGPGETKATPARELNGDAAPAGPVLVSRCGGTVLAVAKTGAYVLDPGLGRFVAVAGFPAGNPLAVSNPDSRGNVWAAVDTAGGSRSAAVLRISPAPGGFTCSPTSLEGISGVGTPLCLRVIRGPVGDELWVAGTEALLRAGPSALGSQPAPPAPRLRAIPRGGPGGAGQEGAGLVVPFSSRGVHIEASSFAYGTRETERYQTMLGGAEDQWSPPAPSADWDLTGLREGRYAFKVRLVTDSGAAGEAAELRFVVSPPWWRSPAAAVATTAAMLAAFAGFLRLRTRTLERRALALERVVGERTRELQEANAAKSAFVANMSHEIRNPMGGILASALALSREPLEPRHQELVTTLRGCAMFLSSLVEDVLDFAAVEAGAYRVARAAYRPREVLSNVLVMLEPRAAGIRIDASVDPALPEQLVGDAARIQQVLVNFMVNAIKYGGRTVSLSARMEGPEVVFSVVDDGEGVPPGERNNLFVRFSRIKAARTSAVPGTGLGLSVCRMLAERMGGLVGYSAAASGGSVFWMRLPLHAFGDCPAPPQGSGRVLVVEDMPYNARALGSVLRDMGFEVDFAVDGLEALEHLGRNTYRVVFLDCDIPRVGGIEVARRFRGAEGPGSRTLLVATTADSRGEAAAQCRAAGMDASMTKPITQEDLGAFLLARGILKPGGAQEHGAAAAQGKSPSLALVLRPAGASKERRSSELRRYVEALDDALRGVDAAHASGDRPAVAAAAHRVLSLARMVDAAALAGTAADIQEFSAVYTEDELASELAALRAQASGLRSDLAGIARAEGLTPAWAS